MEQKKGTIKIIRVTQVNTPRSLLTIKPGTSAKINCREFTKMSTVMSAATRLNKKAGFVEFEVKTEDNGATIIIKRNKNRRSS